MAREAYRRNYDIMTADVFLGRASIPAGTKVMAITEMVSPLTDRLLEKRVIPMVCICLESPIIARDYYRDISKLAGRFKYSIQFKGTEERLAKTKTRFSPTYFPVTKVTPLPAGRWKEKKYLILVNSNKRAFRVDHTSISGYARMMLSQLKYRFQQLIDPWIRVKEIYKDRVEFIHYFSRYTDFHLYGMGWDKKIAGFSSKYHNSAKKAFKGPLGYDRNPLGYDRKLLVMNEFRFAICFENCSFPGYVTEKILDCFLAGVIPVYYGAPDIEEFVPKETYIDYRKFSGMQSLDTYLNEFTEERANEMLKAAADFVASPAFDKYDMKVFFRNVFDKIEDSK
jgi:hypothetical protein